MIDPELLAKLACPESRQPLRLAESGELAALNERIAAGKCTKVGGEKVDAPLESGLVREDGRLIYPIRDDMPRLLVEEGIPLTDE
ncbi:MAG: hypothetical protein KDC14_07445 [Planctomycetes bacterium]|nr:hypothetical protein [Planctomycetota bacterium]